MRKIDLVVAGLSQTLLSILLSDLVRPTVQLDVSLSLSQVSSFAINTFSSFIS
jgi:hypothetical protein